MICFQMLTLVQQRTYLLAYVYVLKTLPSYVLHASSYLGCLGGKEGDLEMKWNLCIPAHIWRF